MHFSKTWMLRLVAVALLLPVVGYGETQADRLPNIIYIYADDLGYGEVGVYGQEKIRTPNLDRMAGEGIRFTQHYTSAPVCAPARCSLLTGKHGGYATIRDNKEMQPLGQHPLKPEDVTIATLLKRHGYATACIGKWGLGPPESTGDPNKHGFDLFFGNNCQRNAHTYYPPFLFRNRERVNLSEANAHVPRRYRTARDELPLQPGDDGFFDQFKGGIYSHDLMIDEALSFIRDHHQQPFFLYYAALLPHLALQVPDDDLAPYLELGWDREPYIGGAYVPHEHPRAAYAAMITRLDREVGQIMALIKELGLDENTLIIFSSDNGASHLNQVDVDFFNSSAGLRGLKGTVYEGGIRVPTLARWPGRIEAGVVTDHPSYQIDVLPTLMEIIDAADEVPDGVNGISFAPTLFGQTDMQKRHEYMIWEFHGYRGQQAVRIGDWKGVRQRLRQGNLDIELYNLAADPQETTNVAAQHPDIVERIRRAMHEQREPSEIFPMPALDN